jgi:hypothetical protein
MIMFPSRSWWRPLTRFKRLIPLPSRPACASAPVTTYIFQLYPKCVKTGNQLRIGNLLVLLNQSDRTSSPFTLIRFSSIICIKHPHRTSDMHWAFLYSADRVHVTPLVFNPVLHQIAHIPARTLTADTRCRCNGPKLSSLVVAASMHAFGPPS